MPAFSLRYFLTFEFQAQKRINEMRPTLLAIVTMSTFLLTSLTCEAQLFPRIRAAAGQVCVGNQCYQRSVTRSATVHSHAPMVTTNSYVVGPPVVVETIEFPERVAGVQSILDRRTDDQQFRDALMAAARDARKSGEINTAQYFKIAAMSRIPKVLANLKASVHEAAIEEGLATTQQIDWDGLAGFIERLIPLIIQLIDLFSFDTQDSPFRFAVEDHPCQFTGLVSHLGVSRHCWLALS